MAHGDLKIFFLRLLPGGILMFFPFFVFAQAGGTLPPGLNELFITISKIFNLVVRILIALAFVYFLYGVFKYISSATTEGKESGRGAIIYGLIGLFVMLAAWGLVNLLLNTFELDRETPQESDIPKAFR